MTGTDPQHFLFIGELAQSTGADPKTIRFYERAGLLMPPRHGKFRTYLATDVQRLKNVLTLRKMGVPIARIRELLAATPDGADVLDIPASASMLKEHLTELHAKLSEITTQIAKTESVVRQHSS